MKPKCSVSLALLAITAALTLTTGCSIFGGGSKPRGWNISITKTTPATIDVDLIGVSKSDKQDWAGYNITAYWSENDLRRREADKVTFDNLVKGQPVILRREDPRWQKWFNHGASELLIIARLPGDNFPAGPDDPRRKFLPLSKDAWSNAKKKTIEIEIQNTRIHVLTPETPTD